MRLVEIIMNVSFLITVVVQANKIGYFWHLSDVHWDPNYGNKNNNCHRGGARVPQGMYGEHNCDAPWSLVESAAHAMLQRHGDDIEFILWTGDGISNSRSVNKMAALTNLTHLLSHVFASHFVFPVLGHDDPEPDFSSTEPYLQLSALWRHWLPSEALVTFDKGGYYTIERKRTRLRLVALNTNLCSGDDKGPDPAGQWAWLEGLLATSKLKNETVYIVGHMGPGVDERVGAPPRPSMSIYHNSKYLSLVRQYSDIITGQFFGHLHSDTFRIVYSESGAPVSRIFLGPSLTPRRSPAGLNNPGVRLYKIEIDTGQVLDYSQYYLDLPEANQAYLLRQAKIKDDDDAETEGPPETEVEVAEDWSLLYNFSDLYSFHHGGSAEELHHLAEGFTAPEGLPLFIRYLQANSVYSSGPQTNVAGAHSHYCAITRLDYTEYQNCLATAAAALAATTAPTPTAPNSTAPSHNQRIHLTFLFTVLVLR